MTVWREADWCHGQSLCGQPKVLAYKTNKITFTESFYARNKAQMKQLQKAHMDLQTLKHRKRTRRRSNVKEEKWSVSLSTRVFNNYNYRLVHLGPGHSINVRQISRSPQELVVEDTSLPDELIEQQQQNWRQTSNASYQDNMHTPSSSDRDRMRPGFTCRRPNAHQLCRTFARHEARPKASHRCPSHGLGCLSPYETIVLIHIITKCVVEEMNHKTSREKICIRYF